MKRFVFFIKYLLVQSYLSKTMQKVLFNEIRKWKGKKEIDLPYVNTHPFFLPLLVKYKKEKINVYSSFYAVLGDGSIWAIIYPFFNLFVILLYVVFYNVLVITIIFPLLWIIVVGIRWCIFNDKYVEKLINFLSTVFVKKVYIWNGIISGIFVAVWGYVFYITSFNLKDVLVFLSTAFVFYIFRLKYNKYVVGLIVGVLIILINLLVIGM